MAEKILEVKEISLGIKKGVEVYNAVNKVSFNINKGQIFGIVGESGCGKSITALSIAGLFQKNVRVTGGQIIFDGIDLLNVSDIQKRDIQGKDISVIFQEPMTSLNPVMKIGKQVGENLKLHSNKSKKEIKAEVLNVLEKVGLKEAEEIFDFYPHQLSGGMRQRVMIAMAIICNPKLIIADEPTTALDVTIQAQILKLLKTINVEYNTAILFISHDLGVVRQLCDKAAVMYAGEIIEAGTIEEIFLNTSHEYTKGLLASIPTKEKRGKYLTNIPGKIPSFLEKKSGCLFASRCAKVKSSCLEESPPIVQLSSNHMVKCNYIEQDGEIKYGGF